MVGEDVRLVYASGECEIDLARRELRVLGSSVLVGGRAFEIIEILVQSAGKLITKDELMSRVWPGAIVMDATLHVHAAAIRKALGPCRNLLKTESRRGYRLLGGWTETKHLVSSQVTSIDTEPLATNLPASGSRLIGRLSSVQRLRDLVSAYRLVTLTGPGGIGKTRLALEVARCVVDEFPDGGSLADLAVVSDPHLVPSIVAGVLGLTFGSDVVSAEAVARAVGEKRLLLVLDNCEHVIDAAATLAGTLTRLCPHTTVMATSREALRIDSERVYRVSPLAVPTVQQLDASEILGHSAPELFISRAKELGANLLLNARGIQTIASICRHLDGIPLAIEFAAARAVTLGTEYVAAGLHDRFALLTNGRRTALPRHRTLHAVLDWSYQLLSDAERHLLQRLAVFSGSFSLDAASVVTNGGDVHETHIVALISNLIAKSLVTSDITGGAEYLRLLETTRVYALAKLTESGELPEFSKRHAEYYRGLLDSFVDDWKRRSTPRTHIDNARGALEWSFSPAGNIGTGVGLAAAAAPVFLAMSLLTECHRWSKRAILALGEADRGGSTEMYLQACLGVSSMQMHGQNDEARAALSRGLAIAEARGDAENQVSMLAMLSGFHFRNGDFKAALHDAQRMRDVVGTTKGSTTRALADSILGSALHFRGNLDGSRQALESAFKYWSHPKHAREVHLGYNFYIFNGIGLALTLWLQGYPAQAAECARKIIDEAQRNGHPASLGLCLSWAPRLFLWVGDLPRAEEYTDRLISHAESHSLGPYVTIGQSYKAILALGRGDARLGVEILHRHQGQLHGTFKTAFRLSLVQGLVAIGQLDEGLTQIDATIGLIDTNGDLLHMPEALRIKGGILLARSERRVQDAELCFAQALDWSRRQGARSWELRAALDLATLWGTQGQDKQARAVLTAAFEQIVDGLDTSDLKAAKQLLVTLR